MGSGPSVLSQSLSMLASQLLGGVPPGGTAFFLWGDGLAPCRHYIVSAARFEMGRFGDPYPDRKSSAISQVMMSDTQPNQTLERVDCVVIGAGVIGLAVARQ